MQHAIGRLTLIAAVLAMAGCASSQSRSSESGIPTHALPTPPGSDASAPTTTTPLNLDPSLRLEDLGVFGREDDRLLWDTTEKLVAECMAALGFTYIIEEYPTGGNRDLITSLYPPDDLVQKYGYDWTISGRPVPPDPPNASNPDPKFHQALNDSGGCVATTFAKTKRQSYVDTLEVIDQAASDIRQRSLSDPRYLAVANKWSECMTQQGYVMSAPSDQKKLLESGDPTSPPMIKVALADYGCQRQVGLAETARDIRVELNTRWIEDNPGTIEAIKAAKLAVIATCKELIGAR